MLADGHRGAYLNAEGLAVGPREELLPLERAHKGPPTDAEAPAARAPLDFIKMGEATRARIVEAAMRVILEVGYHGATTLLVQKAAGVSRGSLLNQFPTRADLMVAVSDHIIRSRSDAYTVRFAGIADDRRRYELLVDVLWEEFKKPGGLARLEIQVAAASDPDLLQRLKPSIERQDRIYRDLIWGLAQRLGVKSRQAVDVAVTKYSAALRGLAIDLLFPRAGLDVEAAVTSIKRAHMHDLDELLAGDG